MLALMLLHSPVSAGSEPPAVSAASAVVMHPASGTVLFALHEDEPRLIASTTKLMTALTASELLDPDAEAEILPQWTGVEGSSMYLHSGESCLVRELLEGLLLASGNDAALALAGIAAGDPAEFVALMNEKCRELGLFNTHFDNPHGLDSPTHRSTARDIALLMEAALKDPLLREIMGMKTCAVRGAVYENHNQLLRTCPGVFAGKTGYTKAAGRCLVSACSRDGMELICVTLSDPDDWRDHASLYDWAYAAFREIAVPAGVEMARCPVISGAKDSAGLVSGEEIKLCIPAEAHVHFRLTAAPFVLAPAERGEIAGCAELLVDGRPAGRIDLRLAEDVVGRSRGAFLLRDAADRLLGIYAV